MQKTGTATRPPETAPLHPQNRRDCRGYTRGNRQADVLRTQRLRNEPAGRPLPSDPAAVRRLPAVRRRSRTPPPVRSRPQRARGIAPTGWTDTPPGRRIPPHAGSARHCRPRSGRGTGWGLPYTHRACACPIWPGDWRRRRPPVPRRGCCPAKGGSGGGRRPEAGRLSPPGFYGCFPTGTAQ